MERIDDLQYKGLKIIQDTEGFCFGIDSVLLTEFAKDIKEGSSIIDIGCGTGILGILLCKKVKPKFVVGIEKQKQVSKMAERSVALNKLEDIMLIENVDIKDYKKRTNKFDVVITNPPYKKMGTGIDAKNEKRQISRYETTVNLQGWIKKAKELLVDRGSLYMVYRTDRLSEVIEILRREEIEPKRIRFVYSKISEQSNLVLIKAVKKAGTFVKIEKPLIIYNEDGSYTEEILKIYKEQK